MNKIKKLEHILKQMGSVLVAYSGGADSTFLLKIASGVLKDKVLAVTADSLTYPRQELVFAKKMAKKIGARHIIIKTDELKDREFIINQKNRCYFCKRELFHKLKDTAGKNGLKFVVDGSNVSDRKDFRPGNQAKREVGIHSPLEEAGLTKADIRRESKKMGLGTWDKPAQACLASRVPYGTKLSPGILERVHKAEDYLHRMGFRHVRVRHYNGLCRIEVTKRDIPELIRKRDSVVEGLKRLRYNYITVDLEGYRVGSLNEVLK